MRFFLENELVKCLFGEDPRAQVTLFHLNKVHSTAGLQQVKHCFDGMIESLLSATQQHPWLWGIYIFTVGLPVILFISFMWPDKRFGPSDQQYYYMNSDDPYPGDPQLTQGPETERIKGDADRAALRKRGTKNKSDLDLKRHSSV